MKVKFCKKNKWTPTVIARLTETHPSINISTTKCIGKCHRCKTLSIAKVDKNILIGADVDDLYDKIIVALLNLDYKD